MAGQINDINQHTQVVLQQLSDLTSGIKSLQGDINDLKAEIIRLQERENNVQTIYEWKYKIDEIVSPTQLKKLKEEVETLKIFKVQAITVFSVVQFMMAVAVFADKIFL